MVVQSVDSMTVDSEDTFDDDNVIKILYSYFI